MNEKRKFEISGERGNIFIKTGTNYIWMGTICEYPLNQLINEHIWKIKILKTFNYSIMIGIATSDFDFNIASYDTNNFGWYYCCNNGYLYSGPPHNYQDKGIKLKYKKNEVVEVMNMKKRSLKFIIEGEDKGDSYINIPLEKPIFPSVLLGHKDDSVEIIDMNKK